ERFGAEFTTGYIYVLKSLSENPEIRKINNLYKIGFTRNRIESRIVNAENEVTYLNAPVRLVLSAEVSFSKMNLKQKRFYIYYLNFEIKIKKNIIIEVSVHQCLSKVS
ncbi:hypothetical protein EN820_54320, partial [bacterium M00.F.Ca.ET.177.01.1.1]